MFKNFLFYCSVFFAFVLVTSKVAAQVPNTSLSAGDSTGKKLEILEAKRYNFQKIDSVGDFVSLAGNVRIRQGKTLFYCDSAVLDQKQNTIEAFGNIHINDEDSVQTYSQYLKYYGQQKDAILKNKVKLTDGKGVLTTNELHYNTITKVGTYVNGGKVVTGTTVLTSTEGIYYGETRDIYFKKKVVMIDPEFRVTTDTLLYNTFTEIARFTVPTVIKNKQRTITTSEGYYDMKNKKAVFGKRPFIDDKDYTLTADDLAIDEKSGFGDALGHAVYKSKDTANPSIIIANRLQSNNKTNALLATQKPVMIIRQGADSIYIAADTLYTARLSDLRTSRYVPPILQLDMETTTIDSTRKAEVDSSKTNTIADVRNAANARNTLGSIGKNQPLPKPFIDSLVAVKSLTDSLSQPLTVKNDTTISPKNLRVPKNDSVKVDSSTNRFIEAYYNVRIFSDSLQAVGDSMFYSLEDSAFRLFKNPVVWAQDNQITGDTIYLFTANKKPKRLYVFENALAINKSDQFFNQVKGNTINGNFLNGDINHIRAKGSAENIYYAIDDQNKYIGVNRSTCDIIDMYFQNKKPRKIVFRNNLDGTTYPMKQVTHGTMRLRGFKWLEDRRPKTKSDLFEN